MADRFPTLKAEIRLVLIELCISEKLPILPELYKNVGEGIIYHHGKLERSEGIAYHRTLTSNLRVE